MNTKQTEALKLALEALEYERRANNPLDWHHEKIITAIREALAEESSGTEQPPCKTGSQCTSKCEQCRYKYDCDNAEQPAQDNTYNYAKSLAEAIFNRHFASDEHYASGRIVWGVNDTVIGILTQIDNMVADMVRRPAQQQEPVAYDKTEINCFAQDLYDQKMREGKRGHYESMFHVIHQCIKKVSTPASKPWVGLTNQELIDLTTIYSGAPLYCAIEAKLKEKNA